MLNLLAADDSVSSGDFDGGRDNCECYKLMCLV